MKPAEGRQSELLQADRVGLPVLQSVRRDLLLIPEHTASTVQPKSITVVSSAVVRSSPFRDFQRRGFQLRDNPRAALHIQRMIGSQGGDLGFRQEPDVQTHLPELAA